MNKQCEKMKTVKKMLTNEKTLLPNKIINRMRNLKIFQEHIEIVNKKNLRIFGNHKPQITQPLILSNQVYINFPLCRWQYKPSGAACQVPTQPYLSSDYPELPAKDNPPEETTPITKLFKIQHQAAITFTKKNNNQETNTSNMSNYSKVDCLVLPNK